ncbi:replication factor C large subunit [Candidatus Woesearchaeota archaeon]|jgi:replication factor C large subunit|nr:replication factor C large subunit [Candidatus Woesearchaeota archaeon]MBT7062718.1 replication factor C large subunit [Candidatus Woesearchaeota archaeon]MBT7402858.1 replication factor C large subunit [Candidatus Woesearchaeota archaeon]
MKQWVQKYQPKKLNEIIGQQKAVAEVYNFWRNFKQSPKKAILVHGPPGCGKTSLIYALANQENLEIVQINASNFRNKDRVESILKPATQQASIFGYRKIILIDEIDGMSGQKDRGGVKAVIEIIKKTRFPIFITANDPWMDKLRTLRNYCQMAGLGKLDSSIVFKQLNSICEMEDIEAEELALKKLAVSVGGDLRAAINDLQSMASSGKITNAELNLWSRERDETILNVLKIIFKSFDPKIALSVSNDIKEDINTLNLWLEQNIISEYDMKSLVSATDAISKSDIFLSRIHRWQHWRFLIYARAMSVVGVQQAKKEANRHAMSYKKPGLIIKMWQRAAKRKKAKGIADQLEGKLHCSTRVLQKDFMPYLNFIEEKNPEMYKKITTSLGI